MKENKRRTEIAKESRGKKRRTSESGAREN